MEAQNGEKTGSRNGSPKCVTNSKAVAFRVDECITTFSNATGSQQSNGTKTIRPQTTFQVTHHKSPSWGVSLPAPTDTEHVELVCIRPFLLMNNINKVDSSRNPQFVHELRHIMTCLIQSQQVRVNYARAGLWLKWKQNTLLLLRRAAGWAD